MILKDVSRGSLVRTMMFQCIYLLTPGRAGERDHERRKDI